MLVPSISGGRGAVARAEPLPALERILNGIRRESPDVVFIDCRTGFSAMSASVLFHLAGLAVVFLPLRDQAWDGVDVLLQGIAAARAHRDNKPGLLFVPSIVPPSEAWRERLHRYLAKLRTQYVEYLSRERWKFPKRAGPVRARCLGGTDPHQTEQPGEVLVACLNDRHLQRRLPQPAPPWRSHQRYFQGGRQAKRQSPTSRTATGNPART